MLVARMGVSCARLEICTRMDFEAGRCRDASVAGASLEAAVEKLKNERVLESATALHNSICQCEG